MLHELIDQGSIIEDTLIIPDIGYSGYLKAITNPSQSSINYVIYLKSQFEF